jgi:hypothetical protein
VGGGRTSSAPHPEIAPTWRSADAGHAGRSPAAIRAALGGPADVKAVRHAAPTGHQRTDQSHGYPIRLALEIAEDVLAPGGVRRQGVPGRASPELLSR